MTDLERKGRVAEIFNDIAANVTDGALKAKIDEAKVLVEGIGVVPAHFAIDEREVIEEYDGGSYCICKTSWYMHFYTKGGYHLMASPKYVSLYGTLDSMLQSLKEGKADADTEAMLMAVTYLIECPMFCFGNQNMTLKLANCIIDCLNEAYESAMNEDSVEDAEKDGDFRDAMESMEASVPVLEEMERRVDSVVKDEGEGEVKEG
jgi:hypothetical protein